METADGQITGDPDTRRVSKFIYPIHNNANIFHFEATIKDRSTDQDWDLQGVSRNIVPNEKNGAMFLAKRCKSFIRW